ncbi:hypothetical protein F5144DRAFT_559120 [Chaetomium tenue]|uniref:Uncharacterized protein n=1 Tax=Chaetomium tenue TaxID=1854479 RepID=A0ACB7PS14_9PEZI|nr:hypothetical protein F5144DRAFT_559120 [Chaetomium globosum]
MAGVPTGRGCDACRKQKKKCDLAKPACSRCTRLRIPCVGCGEKRYKFKHAHAAAPPAAVTPPAAVPAPTPPKPASGSGGPSPPAAASANAEPPRRGLVALRRPPSNGLTRGTAAYIAVLGVSDLRYDLAGCGGFLKDLPRRLGRNKALDASIGALTALFPSLYRAETSRGMLSAYVYALECLRYTLADRATAQTPETLCAIYIITICQGWIGGTDDPPVSHSEAVMHILNCIAVNGWRGRFENQLFLTLAVSVIPESIYNPNIQLGPWFRRVMDNFAPHGTTSSKNGGPGPATSITTLVRLVEFVRDPHGDGGDIADIVLGYDVMLRETAQARANLEGMFGMNASSSGTGTGSDASSSSSDGLSVPSSPGNGGSGGGGGGPDMERIQLLCQAQYAVLLAATMLVNSLLGAMLADSGELAGQVADYPDELVVLNEQTAKYRPVGAGFMPTCLLMASAATTDPAQLGKLNAALAEFGPYPGHGKWAYWAAEMRGLFQGLRYKMSLIYRETGLP